MIALCATLIALCSWITIPITIPFTLQTFAIFVTLGFLGGKRGTLAIVVYLCLGLIGLPVFSGFRGGFGALAGATGGYLIGFLCMGLVYWLITQFGGTRLPIMAGALVTGLLLCYTFGTIWFVLFYAQTTGAVGIFTVLGWCVFPFLLPDAIKLLFGLLVIRRLQTVR